MLILVIAFSILFLFTNDKKENYYYFIPFLSICIFMLSFRLKGNYLRLDESGIKEVSSFKSWQYNWEDIAYCKIISADGGEVLGFKKKESKNSKINKIFLKDLDFVLQNSYDEPLERIQFNIQNHLN